ncbi:hypothetical protein CFC21_056169 [Triticum aestivum]|uniref:Subtilisin-like protease n=3 Tax=Triticum aestivum TaxID=4565 RepID=A0A3B6IMZ0_WHEAT|nr:hypothetical protein CFC21_056169 [Triticum aestivum]
MATHRSLLPAPCITALLLAAVISTDASYTVQEDRREAHLEPADEAGHRTYIVLLEPPAGGQHMDADAHRAWHQSFLPSMKTALGKPRLRRSYRTLVHGFSARLTEREVKRVSAKPGVIRAFPNVIRYLETTRTPAFLGLPYQVEESPEDWPGYGGLGMIIGIVDGGIANNHPSMDDAGFEGIEPPQRWRGSCHKDFKCNRKIIGAKNYFNSAPPLDVDSGHGTHVATIAAGNFVAGANVNGLARGNASGIAPQAHVAVYKGCSRTSCPDESVLSAIIAAVDDGVDVISLSVGGISNATYDHDPIAVASFAAMRAGILVVATAGNAGPHPSTVQNDVPWLMTVGAGTVDRLLMARVVIGGVHNPLHIFAGQSLADRQWLTTVRPDVMHDLLYSNDGDRAKCVYPKDEMAVRVSGRVVICDEIEEDEVEEGPVDELLSSNASAIIVVDSKECGYTRNLVDMGDIPILQVPYNDGVSLKDYSSSPHLKAAVDFNRGTVLGTTPAPTVAYFSSRGPSQYFPAILKPDVLAPGVNILGGIPYKPGDGPVYFGFKSGTSMAAPHVSGAAILLKSAHPSWSPAAIKSALMTTADIVDNSGHGIRDEQLDAANAYKMGAGQINVSRAMDPGLVYELKEGQYAAHVCSTLGEAALRAVACNNSWRCSELPTTHPSNLNYPSITVPLQPRGFIVVRTLTNVAPRISEPEIYMAKVVMPSEVRVIIDPSTLMFNYTGQEGSYQISVRSTSNSPVQGAVYHGTVEWSSSEHTVRSPMLAVVDLATSHPSTPWKLH